MERQTTIRELKGIGDKTAALFARLNIYTIDDLLLHYPVGYDRFLPEVAVNQLEEGQVCAFRGQLQGSIAGRKTRTLTVSTCKVSDTTGEVSLTFFNIPYLKNMIKPGEPYIFRGLVQGKPASRKTAHGVYSGGVWEAFGYISAQVFPDKGIDK